MKKFKTYEEVEAHISGLLEKKDCRIYSDFTGIFDNFTEWFSGCTDSRNAKEFGFIAIDETGGLHDWSIDVLIKSVGIGESDEDGDYDEYDNFYEVAESISETPAQK